MDLHAMTMQEILELSDQDLDLLSASEQQLVAEVIGAVIGFEMRGGGGCDEVSTASAQQATSPMNPDRILRSKIH